MVLPVSVKITSMGAEVVDDERIRVDGRCKSVTDQRGARAEQPCLAALLKTNKPRVLRLARFALTLFRFDQETRSE